MTVNDVIATLKTIAEIHGGDIPLWVEGLTVQQIYYRKAENGRPARVEVTHVQDTIMLAVAVNDTITVKESLR